MALQTSPCSSFDLNLILTSLSSSIGHSLPLVSKVCMQRVSRPQSIYSIKDLRFQLIRTLQIVLYFIFELWQACNWLRVIPLPAFLTLCFSYGHAHQIFRSRATKTKTYSCKPSMLRFTLHRTRSNQVSEDEGSQEIDSEVGSGESSSGSDTCVAADSDLSEEELELVQSPLRCNPFWIRIIPSYLVAKEGERWPLADSIFVNPYAGKGMLTPDSWETQDS